jgi:deoxyxylulose-5-phosphate synthase
MAVARDFKKDNRNVVCVIGDGAMSAGMAFEAMNNAAAANSRLIVVLNDNDMSIAPPVGAMSAYLSRLLSSPSYHTLRSAMKDVAQFFPAPLERAARKAEEYARGLVIGGTMFEELGFHYVARFWSTWSRKRATATAPPNAPPTNTTASAASTSRPARRPPPRATARRSPRSSRRA